MPERATGASPKPIRSTASPTRPGTLAPATPPSILSRPPRRTPPAAPDAHRATGRAPSPATTAASLANRSDSPEDIPHCRAGLAAPGPFRPRSTAASSSRPPCRSRPAIDEETVAFAVVGRVHCSLSATGCAAEIRPWREISRDAPAQRWQFAGQQRQRIGARDPTTTGAVSVAEPADVLAGRGLPAVPAVRRPAPAPAATRKPRRRDIGNAAEHTG